MQPIRELLKFRQAVNQNLRSFLTKHDYIEAETPILSPKIIPESYLEVFATSVLSPDQTKPQAAYLLASPEAYLKRLLVGGAGNIYYLGKAFRNGEPLGQKHNHEFSILEWYKIGYSYLDLMREIEQMLGYVAIQCKSSLRVEWSSPWEYLTVNEAYRKFAPDIIPTQENFEKTYVQYLEPNLGTRGKPTFLYDFPAWQSPLAKAKNGLAERFELYINGVELTNGWTELTDWQKQQTNLEEENRLRKKYGKEPLPMDYGFIESLKQGMPECAGAAMGVDRLAMVLGGYQTIQDILPFPTKQLFTLSAGN